MTVPPLTLAEHVPLSPLTSIRLGGSARYFAVCTHVDHIIAARARAATLGLPTALLGGGSNTIVADEGFNGVVLHVRTRGITLTPTAEGTLVTAAAGEPWDGFVAHCVGLGLRGVECLSGIPGSVGATPIQNVGAYGQEVAETITEVTALDTTTMQPVRILGTDCDFGYRSSRFKHGDRDRYIILDVTFRLSPEGRPAPRYAELKTRLERRMEGQVLPAGIPGLTIVREEVLAVRRKKSMLEDPDDPNARSAGSFFLNPVLSREKADALLATHPALPHFPSGDAVKIPAAWLIEHSGFSRGYRRGGAAISEHHTLALVNRGTTTAELLALAEEIRAGVLARFGVRLDMEPVVLGHAGAGGVR